MLHIRSSLIKLMAVAVLGTSVTRVCAAADSPTVPARPDTGSGQSLYLLGPEDTLSIWALGVEEISDKPVRIDFQGYLDIPIIGRVKAGGLTIEGLKATLVSMLVKEVRNPQVAVNVIEFRSQPVSVVGEVNAPGI
ncbi:MAG TPA: polysaccharide biosynthesis/export family protein, partial [Bryobacteraceae bacterium]|nr:polysaccharide biosynthesis/export family protein [Bryobacteraceae bacterium]